MPRNIFQNFGKGKSREHTVQIKPSDNRVLREGCVLSPFRFAIFIMDLAEELKRKGLGVEIKGHWIGACFFADDVVLVAEASKEQHEMLDLVGAFARDWKMQFNAKMRSASGGREKEEKVVETWKRQYGGS